MKRLLLVAAPVLLLACICPLPVALTGPKPAASLTSPAPTARPTTSPPSPTQTGPSDIMADPQVDLVMVRLHPQNGELENQLPAEVRKSAVLGLRPFVEFDASW